MNEGGQQIQRAPVVQFQLRITSSNGASRIPDTQILFSSQGEFGDMQRGEFEVAVALAIMVQPVSIPSVSITASVPCDVS